MHHAAAWRKSDVEVKIIKKHQGRGPLFEVQNALHAAGAGISTKHLYKSEVKSLVNMSFFRKSCRKALDSQPVS